MELFKGKVVCPRCDGNGLIYKAKIRELDINVFLCDECEAMWQEHSIITLNSFQDFSTFLDGNGLSYNDVQLFDLEYEWYK
ncbi:3'-5' exonuclease [Aneurinibacillus uraniidurans]|uniref:3'-5' exonuclease n=1 Tax=Aneurinibacillus uraniidurans TaxID=2966586 RepID=UPI00234B8C09|nr:3'-5' exonuclease [Aneurinibacillus sp. B1]WCN37016.1 3'-5' exonuclease [Aneurinibacillus sp. B1]